MIERDTKKQRKKRGAQWQFKLGIKKKESGREPVALILYYWFFALIPMKGKRTELVALILYYW